MNTLSPKRGNKNIFVNEMNGLRLEKVAMRPCDCFFTSCVMAF